ncbi:MAG TPA: hypothetical protein VM204_01220, partial [Gaiellaceae bacterium]|nr:hypothetical protein [Gaiellaceae bacterium]
AAAAGLDVELVRHYGLVKEIKGGVGSSLLAIGTLLLLLLLVREVWPGREVLHLLAVAFAATTPSPALTAGQSALAGVTTRARRCRRRRS